MALLHGRHEIIRAWRSAHDRLEIKRDKNCFHAGAGEVVDYLFFALGCPRPIPILGQRVNIRLLARDPLFRIGITMNVDDSHGNVFQGCCSTAIFREMISTNFVFETLPKFDSGNSGKISSRSGNLYLAISLPTRKVFNSLMLMAAPSRNRTQAHMRSPRAASGPAMQATSLTDGCKRMIFSISSALIFSPPRLMRSFFRPSTI